MRVLIIGCGYVGLALGRELAAAGHNVFGLRRTSAAQAEMQDSGITPVIANIKQPETLGTLPADYDWVVLCAGSSGGGPEDYRQVYLEGSRHVLDWLAGSPPQKLVYTSSTSVYAQTDGSLVDETSPTEPTIETSRILVETEALLLDAARQGKIPAIVLRLAGIYGPNRGYWLRQFLQGQATIEDQGNRILNMIHRDDVAGAITKSLANAQPGEIFNVVDDEPATQLTCFQWLAHRLGRPLPPSVAPEPGRQRKRGVTNKRVSNGKLRGELGYRLKYPSFREGYEVEIQQLERSGWGFAGLV